MVLTPMNDEVLSEDLDKLRLKLPIIFIIYIRPSLLDDVPQFQPSLVHEFIHLNYPL